MDNARGGRFLRVPWRYPEEAWFANKNKACLYNCQVAEYFYWVLTTILGGQMQSERIYKISSKWKLHSRAAVKLQDTKAFKIFTNTDYALPSVLPDGLYNPGQVEVANHNSWLIHELKNSTSLTGQLEGLVTEKEEQTGTDHIPELTREDREVLLSQQRIPNTLSELMERQKRQEPGWLVPSKKTPSQ